MYQPCKAKGKLIYMHTDGCIHEIIPDLKDCWVDIVNPQFRANGIKNLKVAARAKGADALLSILTWIVRCFRSLPRSDYRSHSGMYAGTRYERGRTFTFRECAADVPLENIEAICVGLEKARQYFSH